MLSQLLAFELRRRLRQPAFLLLALVFGAYGLTLSLDDIGEGMSMLPLNSPYRWAYFLILGSSLAAFVAMLFANQEVLRDDEHGFAELIGLRAPQPRWYSRWLTLQLSVLSLYSLLTVDMLLGFVLPRGDTELLLPLEPSHVLLPWLLVVLPNSLLCGCLLFWVSFRWRQSGITFAAAGLLFMLSWTPLLASGAPVFGSSVMAPAERLFWLSVIDPFASVAFFVQTQFLTATEKNHLSLQLDAALLINRLIWMLIGCTVAWLTWRRIRTEKAMPSARPASPAQSASAVLEPSARLTPEQARSGLLSSGSPSSGPLPPVSLAAAQWPRFCAQLRLELRSLYRHRAMHLMLLLWLLQVAGGIAMTIGLFSAEYSGRYPTTSLLISYCAEPLNAFGAALLVLFSSQLLWNEKRLRIDALIDNSAVASGCLYAAKLLALISIPALLISVLIVMAAGYQVSVGYSDIDLLHYLSMYWYFGLPLALQAVALFCLQLLWARSRYANRHAGVLLGALFLGLTEVLLPYWLVDYPWLRFNEFPRLLRIHSELAEYAQLGQRFNLLAIYWTALAVCLVALSLRYWPRGEWAQSALRLNGQLSWRRAPVARLAAVLGGRPRQVSLLLFALSALWLWQSLPDQHDFRGDRAGLDGRESYERLHAAFRDAPVPEISTSFTRVAIFPQQQRVEIEADNTIINRNSLPLQTILVSSRRVLDELSIEGAELVQHHAGFGWHSYQFKLRQAMRPGATARMHYHLQHASLPFAIDGGLVANGSYFHQGQIEPLLGYAEALEIADPEQRQLRGLPPRPEAQADHRHGTGYGRLVSAKRRFESIVSTAAGQSAITSGELVDQWQEGGRHYFHYRAAEPIYPVVGYFSAAYAIQRFEHRGIAIEFYVHPAHQRNVESMLAAVRATLDYCTRWFGAYPYQHLRLVEVPITHGFGGRASAGVVALNERLFVEDVNSPALINNVLRNTVHEVAHQWWGEKLVPRITPGEKVINESLAKYVEAVLLEQLQDRRARAQLNDYNRRRYFAGRAAQSEPEPPLMYAEQAHLSYGKGPVVFLALRELLGEQGLNQALKRFIDAHQQGMSGTMSELVDALLRDASPEQAALIQRWLGGVVEYRLSLDQAAVRQRDDGRYLVELELQGERREYDSEGNPRSLAVGEPIGVGLFAEHPYRSAQPALSLHTVDLDARRQRITLLSEQRPQFVAIDPDGTRLEANREDNVLSLPMR